MPSSDCDSQPGSLAVNAEVCAPCDRGSLALVGEPCRMLGVQVVWGGDGPRLVAIWAHKVLAAV